MIYFIRTITHSVFYRRKMKSRRIRLPPHMLVEALRVAPPDANKDCTLLQELSSDLVTVFDNWDADGLRYGREQSVVSFLLEAAAALHHLGRSEDYKQLRQLILDPLTEAKVREIASCERS